MHPLKILCVGLVLLLCSSLQRVKAESAAVAPLDLLPPQVAKATSSGALSLYADYANAKDSQVTLYLVNDTPVRASMPGQDSDLY